MTPFLFFLSIVLFFYAYALYPVVLLVVGLFVRVRTAAQPISPRVSIVISAYNEETVIGAKLQNALALEYPRESIEILVISDCSSDKTDDIVKQYAAKGVRLYRQPHRRGKTAGLNRALELVTGEIVIFTDADALFDKQALARMVPYFNDPQVGLVTGSTRYFARRDGLLVATSSAYTRLERVIKRLETRIGSCVGADGAIFGMRKVLYQPLADDDINDLVIPLKVVRQGYRVVFAPDVYCRETTSENTRKEFNRQIRITNRTLNAIFRNADMLNPRRHALFSFQLISHKLLRFAVPFLMGAILVANIALLDNGGFYVASFMMQLALYGAAAVGYRMEATGRSIPLTGLCYHFLLMNTAILIGWFKFIIRRKDVTWDPRRT